MTNAGHWKSRFTEEQLERKRAIDRASHKKSRQRSRLATAELEQRLRLAVRGDRGTLINRLLDDNARLQSKLDFYRARLESILQAGHECLESEDELPKKQVSSNAAPCKETAGPVAVTPSVSGSSFEFVPSIDSVLHEIASFSSMNSDEAHSAAEEPHDFRASEVVDAVITWKMFGGKGAAGLDFVSERLCMTSNPPCQSLNLDNLEHAVSSEYAYEEILENLLYDAPSPTERSREMTRSKGSQTVTLSEIERQRRAAAICACENSRPWRGHFRSKVEYIALFWAQYRYYLFLICPTRENYERCFPWHRPQAAQFSSSHPSFIDFLVWPRLRVHLARNWHRYSPHDLIASLIQSFEVRYPTREHGCWIKARSDLSGLELDESFERVLQNIDNFNTNDEFGRQYPDLFELVNPIAHKMNANPIYRQTPTPRRYAPQLTRVTKPSRRTAPAAAKRNLRSANFEQEGRAADEEILNPSLKDDGQMSTSTGDTDASVGDTSQGTQAYFEYNSFPLEAGLGSSELTALESIVSLDFASLSNYLEAPGVGSEKEVSERQQHHPSDMVGTGFGDHCQFGGNL